MKIDKLNRNEAPESKWRARRHPIQDQDRAQRPLSFWTVIVLSTAVLAAFEFAAGTGRAELRKEADPVAAARQDAANARQELQSVRRDAQLRESQYLADRATLALEMDKDPTTALLLSLEALPDGSSDDPLKRDRPLWGPAEVSLEAARRQLREKRVLGVPGIRSSAVAITRDGSRLITNSKDNTLRVWDIGTGRELAVMRGHSGGVESVETLPDGNRIVSGSSDGTARVWDLTNGRELTVLRGHRDTVYGVGVSPDGNHVLTASADRTVRIWDSSSGKLEAILRHNDIVFAVKVTTDGLYAVTGSRDGARIFELATGVEVTTLTYDEVSRLALTPDGRRLVTGSFKGTARVWELADGREVLAIKNVERNIIVTPDSKYLIDDKWQWDLETGRRLISHLSTPLSGIRRPVVTPNGENIVVPQAPDVSTMTVTSFRSAPELAVLRGHKDSIWSVAVTPDGKRLITGSHDNTARVWDLATGTELAVLKGHTSPLQGMAVSADGARLLTTSMDLTARVWDLANYNQLAVFKGHTGMVRSVGITPDGTRAVTGAEDAALRVWDVASGRQLAVLRGKDTGRVWRVAMVPGGNRVVATYDNTARVWDLATGREVLVFRGHKNTVMGVAVTPDGTRAITASGAGDVRVWDLATGQELLTLQGHRTGVGSIAVTPDGRRIVTGSHDNTIRVWDVASGRELAVIKGHEQEVTGVAVTPDGGRIVSGSFDNTARIWTLFPSAQALAEDAKLAAPRCLTMDERERFHLAPSPPSWCTNRQKWPYDAGGLLAEGDKLLNSGKAEEAKVKFSAAMAQNPAVVRQIADSYFSLGSFSLRSGREKEAESSFKTALQHDPSAGEYISAAYIERAKEVLVQGKADESGKLFKLAQKYKTNIQDPVERAMIEGGVGRGNKLLEEASNESDITARNKKRLSAFAEFDKAIARVNRDGMPSALRSDALLNRGRAHDLTANYEAAVADFRSAVVLGDDNARSWLFWSNNRLGQQLVSRGNTIDGLLKVWTNILDLEPITRRLIGSNDLKSNFAMRSGVGRLHAELKIAGGDATATECDQLASHVDDPLRRAGRVDFESIDPRVALPACERAVAEHPEEPRLRYLRGRVEWRAASIAAAAKEKETAIASYEAARADFESAMKQNYPMAFSNMASALEKGEGMAKDQDQAAESYAQAFNQLMRCCWVPVARRLLREEGRTDAASIRRIVRELTLWAAALGSEDAHRLLAELTANGTLEPVKPPQKAEMTDLPLWLRP